MPEFPPVPVEDALLQPTMPEVTNADLRSVITRLQNNEPVDRETLLAIGAQLDQNAERFIDNEGNQRVKYRGAALQDEQGRTVLDARGAPKHRGLSQAYASLAYAAAEAAKTSDLQEAWAEAALAGKLRRMNLGEARQFVKAVRAGKTAEQAYEAAQAPAAAEEAEKPKPEEPPTTDEKANEASNAADTQKPSSPTTAEILRQLSDQASPSQRAAAAAELKRRPTQQRAVIESLSQDISEDVGEIIPQTFTAADAIVSAKVIDSYLEKNASLSVPPAVRALHVAAVRLFLQNIDSRSIRAAIAEQGEHGIFRDFRAEASEHQNITAAHVGATAVDSQLPRDEFALVA